MGLHRKALLFYKHASTPLPASCKDGMPLAILHLILKIKRRLRLGPARHVNSRSKLNILIWEAFLKAGKDGIFMDDVRILE